MHPVEAGITCHRHIINIVGYQQFSRIPVLYKNMPEIPQQTQIPLAVPSEKNLIFPENGRYRINRNIGLFELRKIVGPEFILDKNSF